MMKIQNTISCLLLFLLSLTTLQAQSDTIFNQTDANNLKQGYWKKSYPNGKLMYKGYFKNNKPVGEMRRFFESGSVKAILNYDNNGEYARARLYYEGGQLAARGNFFNSLKDSIWLYYSYYDLSLTSSETYVKGVRHGLMINYYSNGDISEKVDWKNDKKDGIWEQYFMGGILRLKGFYVNNKLEGDFRVYYMTGKPYLTGKYSNNQRQGTWTFFKEDGVVEVALEYLNGKSLNEDQLTEKQQDLFKMIDENEGKFEEPDETNFLAPGR